jgi:hypothetical protein
LTSRQPRYTREEVDRRGAKIYEQRVRPLVEADHQGQVVVIDVETGDFEVADRTLTALDRLLARRPGAQTWGIRVGWPVLHKILSPWR